MLPMNGVAAFFERRTDARPLALARMGIGVAVFVRGLATLSLFHDLLTPGVVRAQPFPWLPHMTREAVPWFLAAWLLAAAGFTAGYKTRLNAAVLTVLITYQLAADQAFFWSHVYFLGCLILLLGVADAGADLSLDWYRSGAGRRSVSHWAVTLLKLQISIVYFVASLAKINAPFLRGEVLGRTVLRPEFLMNPEALTALSWMTIPLEAGMAFALWSKRLRPWAIAAGVGFHIAIPGMMGMESGLVIFSVAMIAAYVLFLDREEFGWLERSALQLTDAAGLSRVRQTLMKHSN